MSAKRVTYITYNEGLDSRKLHLGNLVHNTKTPQSFEPYNETTYTDVTEPAPDWAQVIPLENYALTLGTVSPDDDDEDSADEDGVRYRVVAAPRSTKLEIKEQKFFNEVTLKSPEAKKWLASHLSAAAALAPHPPPQVWLLTGLILMTHATWTSLSSKQSFIAGLQAPFDPTGVTAIRRSSVSEHVKPVFGIDVPEPSKHISGAVIHETGKYPGTRGWAAQWERVDIQLLPKEKWDKSDNQFVLKNKTGVTSKVAAVKLQGQVYAEQDDEEEDEDEDDEYWDSFFDITEDLS